MNLKPRIKPTLRERIVDALQTGSSVEDVARLVNRQAAFVKRVRMKWEQENMAAARARRGGE